MKQIKLKNILESLFFDDDSSRAGDQNSSSTPPRMSQVVPSRNLSSLTEDKLLKILTHNSFLNTGRVQLLGLEAIKTKLGEKWPGLRKKVLDALHQIVNKRLRDEDVFFSINDEEHLIVFSYLAEDSARLVCAKILQELSERFLGSAETSDIVVRTATGKLDGELLFKPSSLEDILTKPPVTPSTLKHEEDTNQNPRPPCSSVQDKISEVVSASCSLGGLKRVEPVFMPLWDSKHQVISTYAMNCRLKGRTLSAGGYAVLLKTMKRQDKIALDYFLFETCREMMQEFYANKFRAIFSIPVSYETLFTPELLASYLQLCRKMPEELCRYVSFTLVNFPPGIPEAKLRYITGLLQKYCRLIILHCHEFIPQDIGFYKECQIKGVSINLAPPSRNSAVYWAGLARMTAKCHQKSMQAILLNVQSLENLLLAREAGFDYIAGAVIRENTAIPGHMVRLSWKELLAGKKPTF